MEKNVYPVKRNLDGIYFRVYRDGKWDDVCFTDLTIQEREEMLVKYDRQALARLVFVLTKTIGDIDEQVRPTKEEWDKILVGYKRTKILRFVNAATDILRRMGDVLDLKKIQEEDNGV